MVQQFYYKVMDSVVGPISAQQLRSDAAKGNLTPDTHLRVGDAREWVLASRVKGLFNGASDPTAKKASAASPPNGDGLMDQQASLPAEISLPLVARSNFEPRANPPSLPQLAAKTDAAVFESGLARHKKQLSPVVLLAAGGGGIAALVTVVAVIAVAASFFAKPDQSTAKQPNGSVAAAVVEEWKSQIAALEKRIQDLEQKPAPTPATFPKHLVCDKITVGYVTITADKIVVEKGGMETTLACGGMLTSDGQMHASVTPGDVDVSNKSRTIHATLNAHPDGISSLFMEAGQDNSMSVMVDNKGSLMALSNGEYNLDIAAMHSDEGSMSFFRLNEGGEIRWLAGQFPDGHVKVGEAPR